MWTNGSLPQAMPDSNWTSWNWVSYHWAWSRHQRRGWLGGASEIHGADTRIQSLRTWSCLKVSHKKKELDRSRGRMPARRRSPGFGDIWGSEQGGRRPMLNQRRPLVGRKDAFWNMELVRQFFLGIQQVGWGSSIESFSWDLPVAWRWRLWVVR